jgi:hypothetical protein
VDQQRSPAVGLFADRWSCALAAGPFAQLRLDRIPELLIDDRLVFAWVEVVFVDQHAPVHQFLSK